MEIDRELGDTGLVSQDIALNPVQDDPLWRLLSQLLIIIVIVYIVAHSYELLPQVRACQQQHCHTYYVFLPNFGRIRRISLQNIKKKITINVSSIKC
jgi:hypothetical protein